MQGHKNQQGHDILKINYQDIPWSLVETETKINWHQHSRSKLAEDALRSDVGRALVVGVTDVLLQTLVVVRPEGPDVGLEHGDAGDGRVTDGVLAADWPRGEGAVGERGLEGVQQVHYDVDELRRSGVLDDDCGKLMKMLGVVSDCLWIQKLLYTIACCFVIT